MKGIVHHVHNGRCATMLRIADGHVLPKHAAYLGVSKGRGPIAACDCDSCRKVWEYDELERLGEGDRNHG